MKSFEYLTKEKVEKSLLTWKKKFKFKTEEEILYFSEKYREFFLEFRVYTDTSFSGYKQAMYYNSPNSKWVLVEGNNGKLSFYSCNFDTISERSFLRMDIISFVSSVRKGIVLNNSKIKLDNNENFLYLLDNVNISIHGKSNNLKINSNIEELCSLIVSKDNLFNKEKISRTYSILSVIRSKILIALSMELKLFNSRLDKNSLYTMNRTMIKSLRFYNWLISGNSIYRNQFSCSYPSSFSILNTLCKEPINDESFGVFNVVLINSTTEESSMVINNIQNSIDSGKSVDKLVKSFYFTTQDSVYGHKITKLCPQRLSCTFNELRIIPQIDIVPVDFWPKSRNDWKLFVVIINTIEIITTELNSNVATLFNGMNISKIGWYNMFSELTDEKDILKIHEEKLLPILDFTRFLSRFKLGYLLKKNLLHVYELSDKWHEVSIDVSSEMTLMDFDEAPLKSARISIELNFKGIKVSQLTTEKELSIEGEELKHCVGSYFKRLISGNCLIFSLSSENDRTTLQCVISNGKFILGLHNAHANSSPSNLHYSISKKIIDKLNKNNKYGQLINEVEKEVLKHKNNKTAVSMKKELLEEKLYKEKFVDIYL